MLLRCDYSKSLDKSSWGSVPNLPQLRLHCFFPEHTSPTSALEGNDRHFLGIHVERHRKARLVDITEYGPVHELVCAIPSNPNRPGSGKQATESPGSRAILMCLRTRLRLALCAELNFFGAKPPAESATDSRVILATPSPHMPLLAPLWHKFISYSVWTARPNK
jgi:hypothetical protein